MGQPAWRRWSRWQVAVTLPLLGGCTPAHWPVLDPAGPVGLGERNLILAVIGLMLLVVIPVIGMTFWFAWRYRASNRQAVYTPEWDDSRVLSLLFWLVPGVLVAILGAIAWYSSHTLSPYEPIVTSVKPLTIQVVALDWKWLFIYPGQHIASVNRVVLPVGVPVDFEITSDTVMNSFFIPRLGGQIYAMAGMETRLHLQADKAGSYYGENTQYSGRGFPYQHFEAVALPRADFESWVKNARARHHPLDTDAYARLARPSVRNVVAEYSPVKSRLFEDVMGKYVHVGAATRGSTPPMKTD
jgi:cytochrome o ubiquinol oxidase subunit 2